MFTVSCLAYEAIHLYLDKVDHVYLVIFVCRFHVIVMSLPAFHLYIPQANG
jgi:hypothetical protein